MLFTEKFTDEEFQWCIKKGLLECINDKDFDLPSSAKNNICEFIQKMNYVQTINVLTESLTKSDPLPLIFEMSHPKIEDVNDIYSPVFNESRNVILEVTAKESALNFVKVLVGRIKDGSSANPSADLERAKGLIKKFDLNPSFLKSLENLEDKLQKFHNANSKFRDMERVRAASNMRDKSIGQKFKEVFVRSDETIQSDDAFKQSMQAQNELNQAKFEFKEKLNQLEKSGAKWNLGTSGKVILITAGILALATAAYMIYLKKFSQAHIACSNQKGYNKKICMLNFKIKAAQDAIRKLQEALTACHQSSNVTKCQWSVTRKIRNWNEKIAAWQTKVANVEAKKHSREKSDRASSPKKPSQSKSGSPFG